MLYVRLLTNEKERQRLYTSHHKIMHVCTGDGSIVTDSRTYHFFPGLIVVIPPDLKYSIISDGEYQIISIEGDFSRFRFLNDVSCLRDNFYNEGRMLAEAIVRRHHNNDDYLVALFDAYLKYIALNVSSSESFSSIIHEITKEIENHYADYDFDLASLLRSVGYTEDYVRSKFLQITGMTPVKYLTSVRMNNAKIMLRALNKSTSIQEIAAKCGYFDAAYFSRCFKKLYGMSPKQYREG